MRQTLERGGSELRRIDEGWVVRTPTLPAVWSLNHVYLTHEVDFTDAARLADRHLADLPYRHLVLEQGARLEPRARAAGWKVEHELVMELSGAADQTSPSGAADQTSPSGAVIESHEQDMLTLMRRWQVEQGVSRADELDQLVESARRQARASSERHFGVAGADGRLVAMANLRSDGAVAQVENVYTAPEARRRGHARTLVAHAAAFADGHELTFIVADDDDWPKGLYARLGFRPIGRNWLLHSAA